MRDVRRQVAALGALVLHAERHLEAEQDEQRDPEVAEQQPARHGTRSRKPTPRTVSIQPGSPSFRRSAATWTSIVFEEPYQLVCQTSASSRCRLTAAPGIARERREQLELLRRQLELAAVEGRAAGALVDLEVADPHGPRARRRDDAARRMTARIRAISSRSPYGLTT